MLREGGLRKADPRLQFAHRQLPTFPTRPSADPTLNLLEPMALGTPVVATTKGAEGLDVTDGEHLLLADDPQSFATGTIRLLGDPDLRHCLTTNARRLVEDRYDWRAIGERFSDLVEATHQQKARRKG